MLINVYEIDLSSGAKRLRARNATVSDIMGDDHEETARIVRDLRAKGEAQYGGGAAPFCLILVAA